MRVVELLYKLYAADADESFQYNDIASNSVW